MNRRRSRSRLLTCLAATVALAASAGCGGASREAGPLSVRYHDPSGGWTARVPAGWPSVAPGPAFVRGQPLADPTRLVLRTYRHRTAGAALRALAAEEGITAPVRSSETAGDRLRWRRYSAGRAGAPAVRAEVAVAQDGADAYGVALVARRSELDRLVRTALLPALESFVPGPPDRPVSILARAPRDPSYWPTAGWRRASPASQGMDGGRLGEMVAAIRSARMPIDSVTVVRHGRLVLDSRFGPFADGRLGQPYAVRRLHELQSATKSVTSMLVGIALDDGRMRGSARGHRSHGSPPPRTTARSISVPASGR